MKKFKYLFVLFFTFVFITVLYVTPVHATDFSTGYRQLNIGDNLKGLTLYLDQATFVYPDNICTDCGVSEVSPSKMFEVNMGEYYITTSWDTFTDPDNFTESLDENMNVYNTPFTFPSDKDYLVTYNNIKTSLYVVDDGSYSIVRRTLQVGDAVNGKKIYLNSAILSTTYADGSMHELIKFSNGKSLWLRGPDYSWIELYFGVYQNLGVSQKLCGETMNFTEYTIPDDCGVVTAINLENAGSGIQSDELNRFYNGITADFEGEVISAPEGFHYLSVGEDITGKTIYCDAESVGWALPPSVAGGTHVLDSSNGQFVIFNDTNLLTLSSGGGNFANLYDGGEWDITEFTFTGGGTVTSINSLYSSFFYVSDVVPDATSPTWTGQTTYYIQYDAPYTQSQITDQIKLIDDDNTQLAFTVTEDTYQANIGKVGNYHLLLHGADASGNPADLTINLIVDDFKPAVLTQVAEKPRQYEYDSSTISILRGRLYDGSMYFSENNAFFNQYFTVADDYCDSANHVPHPEQYYPWVCDTISIVNTTSSYGTLEITGRYIDCRNNETSFTLSVPWGDNTIPQVSKNDETIKIDVNTVNVNDLIVLANGLAYFKANFTVTDAYCTQAGHTDDFVYDLNFSLANGNFVILGSVTDCKGNFVTVDEAVPYGDYQAPVFNGETEITKSRGAVVTIADFVTEVKKNVTDLNTVTSEVTFDTYTGNGATIGDYVVKVKFTDTASNANEVTFNIHVIDDIAPRFIYDGTLFIDDTTGLTKEQIVSILKRVGMLPNVQLSVRFDSPYFANTTATGDYTMSLDYSSPTGQTGTLVFNLSVLPSDPDAIEIPVDTVWLRITNWWKASWGWFVVAVVLVVGIVVLIKKWPKKKNQYRYKH